VERKALSLSRSGLITQVKFIWTIHSGD
jgi:hypothetical protein